HLRAGGFWSSQLATEIAEATGFVLLVGEKGLGPWQVLEYDEALDRRGGPPPLSLALVFLEGGSPPRPPLPPPGVPVAGPPPRPTTRDQPRSPLGFRLRSGRRARRVVALLLALPRPCRHDRGGQRLFLRPGTRNHRGADRSVRRTWRIAARQPAFTPAASAAR